jgi:hypothetical protein
MMTRNLAALLAGILLAGVVMPGTPPPKRHDKSPVLGYTERFAATARKSEGSGKTISRPEEQKTIDRSARTRLPAKNLK